MAWIIVGLGNPGAEYIHTRHNAGRMAVEHFVEKMNLGEWKHDKAHKAQIARGALKGALAVYVLPDTFMNKSGSAVAHFVKSHKMAEKCIVLYDDLDLPFGTVKMSFNRGSGGHKGVESIARALKTKAFWRIRIGVSPTTASGKLKKPQGEKEVLDFILGKFKPTETREWSHVFARITVALEMLLTHSPMDAMGVTNAHA
jgi:peptidyl-tRNA hydrolase, PTH1 family